MLVNVAQLLKEGVGASRHVKVEGELDGIDENNPGPVPIRGNLTLVHTPGGILVTGNVDLDLVQACRRCLELFGSRVQLSIEEEFVPSVDILTGYPMAIPEGTDDENIIDEYHILHLTEVLRQCAMVGGAGFGLCRADCRGLCPTCGSNLNAGPCGCDAVRIDSRFSVLAKLIEEQTDTDE